MNYSTVYYNEAKDNLTSKKIFKCLDNLNFKFYKNCTSDLNSTFKNSINKLGYINQVPINSDSKMTLKHFSPIDNTIIEPSFSNCGRRGLNLLKFQYMYNLEMTNLIINIVLKKELANFISASLINFEQLENEIKLFQNIITAPIILVGID